MEDAMKVLRFIIACAPFVTAEKVYTKKRRPPRRTPLFSGKVIRLEVEAQAKLHPAPVMRVGQMQERPRAKVSVDGVELSVVEKVEVFPAEVESRPLVNW